MKEENRVILHCDCNGFYASVACVSAPELRRVPMAVCGDPGSRHGIILAKNEIAKQYGVATAETVWQARKKCRDLVLVPPNHEEYARYSRIINEIYYEYSDRVEPFGIDESWIDLTAPGFGIEEGKKTADSLRDRIRTEVGLTISVGVSFNKAFAKLGSDYKKPDATTVISRENFKDIVYPLPVSALLYVGKRTRTSLSELGIGTIGQLADFPREVLTRRLGKAGALLHKYANGEDDDPVRRFCERREVKSVGRGITFRRNLVEAGEIRAGITALCDDVAARLRRDGLYCKTVQLQIRFPDFRTISRQIPLQRPTNLSKELAQAACEILNRSWENGRAIRMLTVTATQLCRDDDVPQLSLFSDQAGERKRKLRGVLEHTIDTIRDKYGDDAVLTGSTLHHEHLWGGSNSLLDGDTLSPPAWEEEEDGR